MNQNIMKHGLFVFCSIILFTAAGCKKNGTVSFCEGADKDGKGVKCGTVFTPGDITLLFTTKAAFETDSVVIKVYNMNDGDKKSEQERIVKVSPDEATGRADLEMYDEGKFRVIVEKKGEIVSEGEVELVDQLK
jgi:hypothetical protein